MTARLAMLIATLAGAVQVGAGGPVAVQKGRAVAWPPGAAISYWFDDGPFGSIAGPQAVVTDALAEWSKVATASVLFKGSSIGKNVRSAADVNAILTSADPRSTVLLDEDGSVFKTRFGSRGAHILAVAYPRSNGNHLDRFHVLLNGARLTTRAELFRTVIHEGGHALGLDHAQLNWTAANNGTADDDVFLPIMYPNRSKDRAPSGALTADDVAAVSALYEGKTFKTIYGRLTGTLQNTAGAVRGANVVALRLTPDPAGTGHDRSQAFSCVSDYLKQQNGQFDFVLPPGRYQLHVEPIRFEFVDGSSVGPYAATIFDASFVNRVKAQTLPATYIVAAGLTQNAGQVHVK